MNIKLIFVIMLSFLSSLVNAFSLQSFCGALPLAVSAKCLSFGSTEFGKTIAGLNSSLSSATAAIIETLNTMNKIHFVLRIEGSQVSSQMRPPQCFFCLIILDMSSEPARINAGPPQQVHRNAIVILFVHRTPSGESFPLLIDQSSNAFDVPPLQQLAFNAPPDPQEQPRSVNPQATEQTIESIEAALDLQWSSSGVDSLNAAALEEVIVAKQLEEHHENRANASNGAIIEDSNDLPVFQPLCPGPLVPTFEETADRAIVSPSSQNAQIHENGIGFPFSPEVRFR